MAVIVKHITQHQTKRGGRWVNDRAPKVYFITPEWARYQWEHGDVCGNVRRYESEHRQLNTCPDGRQRTVDTFDPVRLAEMGWRESNAYVDALSSGQRVFPVVDESDGHCVVSIGTGDAAANYDTETGRWC